MDKADTRLQVLARQLTLSTPKNELYSWLVHDNEETRHAIFEFLKDDLYRPNYYQGLMDFREQTLRRLQAFCKQKFFKAEDYLKNPRLFMCGLESLAFCDYSLSIKAGVHFTLCGGTICKLGTAKHHAAYLHKMDTLELPGCFGMTELGHGSNVMGIETTAHFDAATAEFIINTPTDEASKYWIGGAAQHGKLCAVFAQLTIQGKWQGPHVFMVRIRDDSGALCPGVRIEDNGPKMGLNGVDNGRIWFHNVRVPLDSMLDRYASVSRSGEYSSPIPSVSSRFGVMVGGLTTGRMLIAQAAIDSMKMGVTIATRYSLLRPQFGDKPIMSYLTHQLRLVPSLATAYAMHLAVAHLKKLAFGEIPMGDAERSKAVHVLSSGLKAAATWYKVDVLQKCRECCGGQGFLAANKIGPMAVDTNVDVTFEGDNTVMMQQVAKALLDVAVKQPSHVASPSVSFQGSVPDAQIQALLHFRQAALVEEVAAKMRAAIAAAPSQAAAAQASNAVFEDNMDVANRIGWAYVESNAFKLFCAAVPTAPACSRAHLQSLCSVYGIFCLHSDAAFFLGSAALRGADVDVVKTSLKSLCRGLTADQGKAVLALCDGFGIPDHCLQAPIAFDWKKL